MELLHVVSSLQLYDSIVWAHCFQRNPLNVTINQFNSCCLVLLREGSRCLHDSWRKISTHMLVLRPPPSSSGGACAIYACAACTRLRLGDPRVPYGAELGFPLRMYPTRCNDKVTLTVIRSTLLVSCIKHLQPAVCASVIWGQRIGL